MALDKTKLSDALVKVFTEEGPTADGSADEVRELVAKAIADAIHAYVSAAQINGVVVSVVDAANKTIGTGTQTNGVSLT